MATYVSGVKLRAEGASEFLRAMTQAQGAVDSFQKAAGKSVKFDMSSAGSAAATSFTRAFDSGLSPLQTITQGALLRVGAIATNTVVSAFAAAGRAASQAFGDAMSLEQSVANIASLADGGTAAAGAIAQAVGAVAIDPKLIANTQSAALAFQQLEKQGLSTSSIIGDEMTGSILRATVSLQNAAGQAGNLVELREAAEVVGQGMALFGLEASQAGGLVDTFAAITTNTKFDLNDLNYILANSATAIQALGLSYTDIGATAIATGKSFSSARTQATALESFLLRLSAPTDKAREALDLLGVSAYDSSGQFVGLLSLQDQLQAAFTNGQYTAEAFANLMVEAFGLTGSAMATALAQGEDLTASMQTLGATSAEAIAAIKTDTLLVALQNLGDVASDLARRLLQPFVEGLTPAIQAASSLLGSLAGTFDFLGQRIAASLSPVINFVTQQFNTLAQTIAAVTGASISLPSLGAGAASAAAAAPITGATRRPITANSDASASARQQGELALQQGQIGREQLEAAKAVGAGAQALESALSGIEGVFDLSKITQDDLDLGDAYQEKADEFVRRLNAAAESGGKEFPETIAQAREALERVGIVPSGDLKVLAAQIRTAWADSSLFAAKENIALINEEAIQAAADAKEKAAQGRANLVAAFGGLVDQLVAGTNAGLSGGGGVAATPIVTPELPAATEAQQQQLFNLYNKNIEDVYAGAATASTQQTGAFDGLFEQFDTLTEKLGAVGLIFVGFNTILDNITKAIAGQDFTAAGAAVSGTLTTVLDALTGITDLADIGATTASLSSFVQTLLDSATKFTEGLDGAAIAESASNLLGAVVGAVADAFGSADLVGVTESAGAFLLSVVGFVNEAITGADLSTIGTSAAGLALAVGGQIAGALQNIKFGEIGLAALSFVNKLGGQIAAAITEFAGSIEAVDMTQATTILSGAVTSVTGFAADITAIDLTGVNEARTAIGEAIAGIATSIATAVDGLDGEAIGADISAFASNLVGLLADGIKAVPLEEIGVAAANLVGALASTFQEAFTIDNLAGVGESIGGLLTGIVEQLTATLSNPEFGESLGTALGDLVVGIIQGAAGLLQGLSGGLEGEAVAGIGGAIGTFVQGFVEGLAGSLVSADWSGIGTAIYEGITGAASTLFSGAEGLADAIFAVPFELGKSLEENTGIASGTINFFADIADRLKTDLATAFAKDALYPPELAGSFSSIAQSISGAFTSIYDAIAGFVDRLSSLLPSWPFGDSATTPTADAATPADVTPVLQAATAMSSAAEQMNYAATTVANQALQNLPAGAGNTMGDVEFLTTLTPDSEKALDGLTKAVVNNTNVYAASGATEQAGGFINPEAAAQLGILSTTIPTAGSGFISTLTGATSSTGEFIGPMDEATAAAQNLAEATDNQLTAVDKVAGSFNTLLDKSDTTAESLNTLNESLGNQNISQSLDAFVAALDETINGMNKALDKLGTEAPPPTETTPTPPPGTGPFASGTRHYPGGRGLGGEEGPELYITPDGYAGLLGRGGPELFTAPVGTQIYPADMTQAIMSRGARGLGGSIFAAAGGAGSILLDPIPITLPPVTIPINENDGKVTKDEPTTTSNNGISSDLLAQFLQGLGQSGLSAPGFNPGQLAQQVSNAAGNTAKTTAQQIAELFTRPLGGGRYSAPQTQIININASTNQDNSVSNYNYNYGGLQMKSMRSTENLARDFRLLQAVAG